jgi:hypothetical protein
MSTAEQRSHAARVGAHALWSQTPDDQRGARTEAARRTFRESFEDEIDPRHELPEAERVRRGEALFQAHMSRMRLNSIKTKRRRAEVRRLSDDDQARIRTASNRSKRAVIASELGISRETAEHIRREARAKQKAAKAERAAMASL